MIAAASISPALLQIRDRIHAKSAIQPVLFSWFSEAVSSMTPTFSHFFSTFQRFSRLTPLDLAANVSKRSSLGSGSSSSLPRQPALDSSANFKGVDVGVQLRLVSTSRTW